MYYFEQYKCSSAFWPYNICAGEAPMAYVNLYCDKKFNKVLKMIKSFTNVFGFIDDRRAWDVVCQGFENSQVTN